MVTVITRQHARALTDEQARKAEALNRLALDLARELNITLTDLSDLGFTADISISFNGAAPGN